RAHASLGRLGRDDLVREDADPHFATALQVVGDRASRRLDLAGGDPRWLERANGELAKGDGVAARGDATQAAVGALHHLAVLHTLGLQHGLALLSRPRARRGGRWCWGRRWGRRWPGRRGGHDRSARRRCLSLLLARPSRQIARLLAWLEHAT